MKFVEKIPVYIKFENGKTVCICRKGTKKCKSKVCTPDTVERDKYDGWESTFYQNRYGK